MNAPSSDTAELLRTVLHERDFRRSQAAAKLLVRIRADELAEVIAALAAALQDPEATRARRAALALARLGPAATAAEGALLTALTSPRWVVREAVVQALARVASGSASARPLLLQCALGDPRPLVRDAAVLALSGDDPMTLSELRAALRHPRPRRRRRAVRAWALLRPPPADQVTVLADALTDAHGRVRRTAAESLGLLGSAAVAAVPALLRRLHERERGVAAAATATLVALAPSLPTPLAEWLSLLTRPGLAAEEVFQEALRWPGLSETVRQEFDGVRQRRAAWHRRDWSADREANWLLGWLWQRLTRD